MYKYAIPLLLWSLSAATDPTHYYFANDGSDSAAGTSTAPWKTLAKLATVTIQPGDTINLHCGHIWYETLDIHGSAVADPNADTVTIQGYECANNAPKPVISGAASANIPGNAWTLDNGSSEIYYTTLSSVNRIKYLLADNNFMRLARHPNSGYLTATSNAPMGGSCATAGYEPAAYLAAGYPMQLYIPGGSCFIEDSALPLAVNPANLADMNGAGIHFRTTDYWLEDGLVSSVSSTGVITLQYKPRFSMDAGWKYYVENRPWMFDQAGEWIFNEATHTLYVWMPNGSAPGNRITYIKNDYGILAYRVPPLTITGIAVTNTGSDAIFIGATPKAMLSNLTVSNAGRSGIVLDRVTTGKIQTSTIDNVLSNGIQISNGPDITICDNVLTNIGTRPLDLGSPVGALGAIANMNSNTNNDSSIVNNTVQNTSFYGIRTALKGEVRDNVVHDSCAFADDCGAIYVHGIGNAASADTTTIESNEIDGVAGSRWMAPDKPLSAAGIYLDDDANHVNVTDNNVITDADYGILVHNAHLNTITGNTVSDNRKVQLLLSFNGNDEYNGGNEVTHNELHSDPGIPYLGLWSEDTAISWSTGSAAANQTTIENGFGTFDYNNYHGAASAPMVIDLRWYLTPSEPSPLTFSQWQNQTLQDANGGAP